MDVRGGGETVSRIYSSACNAAARALFVTHSKPFTACWAQPRRVSASTCRMAAASLRKKQNPSHVPRLVTFASLSDWGLWARPRAIFGRGSTWATVNQG